MKKQLTLLSSLFLFFLIQNLKAQIAVNTDGSNADSSAIFDVKSTSKGLLTPRIDLVSTTDATTILGPATGLLIYNTRSGITGVNAEGVGFYYNSGTPASPIWVKMNNNTSSIYWKSTGNSAIDSVNNFVGTTDAKSLQLRTRNKSRINLTSNGITTIGDGTNQIKIDSTGHLTFEGGATTFTDLTVPPFSTYLSGSNSPTFVAMKNNGSGSRGVQTFTFQNVAAASEQEVFFSIQMPHSWKEGTTLYPHVHWSPQTATTGSVTWGFEYSWVNYDPTTPLAFPNTTIITATTASVGAGDVDKHLIVDFAPIIPSSSQNKISSIMMCRLFRNSSNAADTYTGDAALLSFDLHYEMDEIGSNSLYSK